MLSFILSFFHLDIVSLTCKAHFVLANCSYPRFLERPFCYWLKLIFILKTVFLNYLFVLLYLLYSVFNEHLRAKHFCVLLVGSNGLEPSTSRLSGARSSHLSYAHSVSVSFPLSPWYLLSFLLSALSVPWWRWWDSNPWPPACRAGALPTELHPHRCVQLCFFQVFPDFSG